ncbi:TMV resistance protein N-like isoform X2 [Vigna radiata var. radiata]|uniref:TMV resistance protein N-like isoform X2 n=1 Tax=Vigna radiata var. radiata TaxID=3916 RepID=A0A1S3UCU8_VIGRR|nr:TMV resistance protein N-like isoform X2 [Vigna radiata var. radiata]
MSCEPKSYDVFLSLGGKDVRYTFTGNLFNALRSKRIKTLFREHEYEPELHTHQTNISPSVLKALQTSKISIVVFSPEYASSSRRLDELVAILECRMRTNQLVWPIFYGVEPTDVRFQRGRYEQAMNTFEERYSPERMNKWRSALAEVSNLSGWFYQKEHKYEYKFIRKIVEAAVQSLSRYDVFLSFCGEDTRYTLTGFLYNALSREGFKIFMDDEELEGGNQISQKLMGAIESSRVSIVVFSENYGYSTWCLDELAKITECMKTKNQMVWPIFYNVEKSDVCNQTKSYGEAMTAHEKRFGKDSEKVQKWRSALSQITNLEGEHLSENESVPT